MTNREEEEDRERQSLPWAGIDHRSVFSSKTVHRGAARVSSNAHPELPTRIVPPWKEREVQSR